MKGKKAGGGAFAHTSTGYGRHHSKHNHHQNASKAAEPAAKKDTLEGRNNKLEECLEKDKDVNSGFGDYLRSPEALEMMKLFVFANSIMLIVTMAWPNIKELYYVVRYWLETLSVEQ